MQKNQDGIIEARGFALVGKDGRRRGVFQLDENDNPVLSMMDAEGVERAWIGFDAEFKVPGIALCDANGTSVLLALVTEAGRGLITSRDAGGEPLVTMGATDYGQPALLFFDSSGNTAMEITIDEQGQPHFGAIGA